MYILLLLFIYRVMLCCDVQAHSQPSDNGGGVVSLFLGLFQGLIIGVLSDCLGETSILKIIMTDYITRWSKLKCTW